MQDLLNQPQIWHRPGPDSPDGPLGQRPSGLPRKWVLLGGGLTAVLVATVLIAVLTQPRSRSYQQEAAQIRTLIEQGKTDLAVGFADLYLSHNDASEESRLALASVRYVAALQEIFKHPEAGGEAAVLRWQEAEAKADELGLPKESRPAMTCFTNAYNARIWPLARACFLTAWSDEKVGPSDRQQIAGYGATLYNWGRELVQENSDDQQGWQWVATGCTIDEAYRLYQGVACKTLRDRFGRTTPPPLADDPVLSRVRS